MPQRLPIELLDLIARFSSTGTLLALSCSFKALHAVSVRLIYTSITLAHPTNPTRTIRCLKTLAHNAEFASLVHTFKMTWFKSYGRESLDALYDFAPSAFEQMLNLSDLSLCLNGVASFSILSCAKFKLRRLDLENYFHTGRLVQKFLETQSSIESLSLRTNDSQTFLNDLSPNALPALSEIVASIVELNLLLPQRLSHLRSIHCRPASFWDIEEVADLIVDHVATTPLKLPLNLGFDLKLFGEDTDSIIEKALSDLGRRVGQIGSLTLQAAAYGSFKRETLLINITSVLRSCSNLHTLVLVSERQAKLQRNECIPFAFLPPVDELHNMLEHRIYLDAWGSARSTLRRVELPNATYMRVTDMREGEGNTETTSRREYGLSKDSWILL